MNDLRGKVAVITGTASGIGRALALQLGQERNCAGSRDLITCLTIHFLVSIYKFQSLD
jgi:short-subunit dehydrogenase involved in D-alanine esterification of teichoic acids